MKIVWLLSSLHPGGVTCYVTNYMKYFNSIGYHQTLLLTEQTNVMPLDIHRYKEISKFAKVYRLPSKQSIRTTYKPKLNSTNPNNLFLPKLYTDSSIDCDVLFTGLISNRNDTNIYITCDTSFTHIHSLCDGTKEIIEYNKSKTDLFLAASPAIYNRWCSLCNNIKLANIPLSENMFNDQYTDKKYTFLFLGRNDDNKRIDIAIDTFLSLRSIQQCKNITMMIASNNVDMLKHKYGKDKGIYFNTSWIDEKQTIELLRSSKLLIITSKLEGGPTTLLEAIANKTNIATTETGIVNYLPNYLQNSICKINDKPRLNAWKIYNLISSPEKEKDKLDLQRFIYDEHNIKSCGDRLLELF